MIGTKGKIRMKVLKCFLVLIFLFSLTACGTAPTVVNLKNNPIQFASTRGDSSLVTARQKIKHIIIIMQENRSFDNYFGTYPGADGLPLQNGKFTTCVNDPQSGK